MLREADLFARRERFGEAERASFWRQYGYDVPATDAMVVSLFAYDSAPLEALLDCWSRGPLRIVAAIPEGPLLPRARAFAGNALEVRPLPFLAQSRYDELLWSCDINFVRGEDSFVRAQWAAKPLAWHIYPQQERAHERKLDAFLNRYCADLTPAAGTAVAQLMRAWNAVDVSQDAMTAAWQRFVEHRRAIENHALEWADRVAALGDLAANLADFCRGKLK